MKETIRSLERKLNKIIDDELQKDVSQIDDRMVMECCDTLLRMDDVNQYMITEAKKNELISAIVSKKSKSVRKMMKPIKILLIAAIIIVLLAVGSLGYAQYKYNIFNFSDHSIINFSYTGNNKVNDLKTGYIPDGFVLNSESKNKYEYTKEYAKDNEFFIITKLTTYNEININTEYKDGTVKQIAGIDYIVYGDVEHGQGIVWEKNECQYTVSGNLSSQDLLKIALSVE